jgi:hypothetical protein
MTLAAPPLAGESPPTLPLANLLPPPPCLPDVPTETAALPEPSGETILAYLLEPVPFPEEDGPAVVVERLIAWLGMPVFEPFASFSGPDERIEQVALLQRGPVLTRDDDLPFTLQLTPPSPGRLFRLESEAALRERIRQESRAEKTGERIEFPEEGPGFLPRLVLSRSWPRRHEIVEPNYLNHGRLLFEQKNAERYGWDLGVFHPALAVLTFYSDVLLLPGRVLTSPGRCYESSAGHCLPGDPVPLRLFPVLGK